MKQLPVMIETVPSVDRLLNHPIIKELVQKYRYEFLIKLIRKVISEERDKILKKEILDIDVSHIVSEICERISGIEKIQLKPVINGTGILLHTNLGRAPLGKEILKEMNSVIGDYSNLEFNLNDGKRGKRKDHFGYLIRELLNIEDVVVVNNNAASVYLCLKALADNKEVIVSRGELIEIGDSFRIPEIMNLSGAKMVEIGSTNKTKLKDYEQAISPDTTILFKTHRSNFSMHGFTAEVSFKELVELAKKRNLITVCDIGSGLLFKHSDTALQNEFSIEEAIQQGIDLVMFSGDKLLGGPQCGIIVGKKELISKIESHPLMRTYRVDKLTIVALITVLKGYLYKTPSDNFNPTYNSFIGNNVVVILQKAKLLFDAIDLSHFKVAVIPNKVQCGGGTLPDVYFDSYAIEIKPYLINVKDMYLMLLRLDKPIVSYLKRGRLIIDLFCIDKNDIPYIAHSLNHICKIQ